MYMYINCVRNYNCTKGIINEMSTCYHCCNYCPTLRWQNENEAS